MSLKGFHIVFIIFSTLLALGTGAWCIWVDLVEGAPIYLAGAILSFAAAVVLLVYGVWFYRKMKRLRIITLQRRLYRSCLYLSFARRTGTGMSVLLECKRWKIDRAHGGGNLVPFWRGYVCIGWDRSVQFSSLAAWAYARRTLSRDHRGR